jgi:hypothetical protein
LKRSRIFFLLRGADLDRVSAVSVLMASTEDRNGRARRPYQDVARARMVRTRIVYSR